MISAEGNGPKDALLDELILEALCGEPADEELEVCWEDQLTPEDRDALGALGPEFLGAILDGRWRSRSGGGSRRDEESAVDRPGRNPRPAAASPRSRSKRLRRVGVCALALAALVFAAVLLPGDPRDTSRPALAGCRLVEEPGARYELLSPRRLRLDHGTLHLDVEPEETRFVVETAAGEAEVLGTSFSITADEVVGDRPPRGSGRVFTRVLVFAGRVLLSNSHGSQVGRQGQILFAEEGSAPVVKTFGAPRGPWDEGLPFTAVAVSPDGRHVLTADEGQTLKVWDAETGVLARVFHPGHDDRITSLAVSPDGRTVATSSWDETARLSDFHRGVPLRTLEGHAYAVNAMVFTTDGSRILSGSTDGTMKLWEVGSGRLQRTFSSPSATGKGEERYHRVIVSIDLDRSGRVAVSGNLGGRLDAWDVKTGTRRLALAVSEKSLFAVAVDPDGATALAGCEEGTLSLWDLRTGNRIWSQASEAGPVTSITLGPKGRSALLLRAGSSIEVWDPKTGRVLRTLSGHRKSVASAAFFPDGTRCVSAGADGTLKVWEVGTGRLLNSVEESPGEHSLPITALRFHPSGRQAVSGSEDGTIQFWSVPEGKAARSITAHEGAVRALAFGPDGSLLLSAGDDRLLKMWKVETREACGVLRGHEKGIRAIAVSPCGKLAASGGLDAGIRIWDLEKGKLRRTLEGIESRVIAVRFSPDGHHVLAGNSEGRLRKWDVATGERVWKLYTTEVSLLEFSPDCRRALAPSMAFDHPEPGLHLWNLESKRCWTLKVPEEPRFFFGSAVFTGDGMRVVAARGTKLWVWDVATRKMLQCLTDDRDSGGGPAGSVTALAASPDGRYAMTASVDRSVRLFTIATD